MPTIRTYQDNGTTGASTAISVTLTGAQVGDTVLAVFMDDFFTFGAINNPGGTAVTSWTFQNAASVDGGTNDNHIKVWTGTVTTAGGTVTVSQTDNSDERVLLCWVFVGAAAFDTGAGTDADTNSTSHVAPSVTPQFGDADDYLICAWGTLTGVTNYTVPGSMTARTEWDLTFATFRGAEELLSSSAATGTRTATSSASDNWIATSILIRDVAASAAVISPTMPGKTWMRRFKNRQILPMVPATAGPQNYQQALNAGLSFTSSDSVLTSKTQSASLSFTSSLFRAVKTSLPAAALSFTSSMSSAVVHHFTQALNATLSFTSSQTRSIGTHLSGALSFTSAQTRRIAKGVAATLSFTSSQPRAIRTNLPGAALSFTSSQTRRTAKNLGTAVLSFTSSMTTQAVHVFTQALNATLSFTSSQTRSVGTHLSGALGFTSSITRRTSKGLSAALSFTSAQSRAIRTNLAGALSFTSSQTRRTAKNLGTATLSFTSSLTSQAVHFFTQALNASLSFTGSLSTRRIVLKALTATLSFTGSQTRRTGKSISAGLSFTSSHSVRIAKKISAALGLTGIFTFLSSAIPTTGSAEAASFMVPGASPGTGAAAGASAGGFMVPDSTPGTGTVPTSSAGNSSAPTSSP